MKSKKRNWNLEKKNNTEIQLEWHEEVENFLQNCHLSEIDKSRAFTVFTSRQSITLFLERYELFKKVLNVPGDIFECGVGDGKGLMAFAHFSSIFEPYHYVRKIVGFDTFKGFTKPSKEDASSQSEHMVEGGLNFDTYDVLKKSIKLYDKNRVLGHIPKVSLIKGDISKTLKEYLKSNPQTVISCLYLDLDLFKPTLDTINLLKERLHKNSIIAFDELNHRDYPGETIAVMKSFGLNNLKLEKMHFSSMSSFSRFDL